MIHETAQVSPLAHVDGSATLGANVVVEPFAFVGPDVHVGEGSWVGPHATLLGNTKVGRECKLFPGCVVGADSQDLKYKGEPTSVEIGDRTSIRECVTVHRATTDKMITRVGSDCAWPRHAAGCRCRRSGDAGHGTAPAVPDQVRRQGAG